MEIATRLLLAGALFSLATEVQAADLPSRKAEPVDYVRVCSLGSFTGFVIPGTDVCLKVGGFVRYQYTVNQVQHGFRYVPGVGGYNSVTGFSQANGYGQRADASLKLDARTETEYGLLRSFTDMRIRQESPSVTGVSKPYVDKAYIQFGPWTFGYFQSFFDFYSDNFNNIAALASDADLVGAAYTAKLGNRILRHDRARGPEQHRHRERGADPQPPGGLGDGRRTGRRGHHQLQPRPERRLPRSRCRDPAAL